MCVVHVFCMVNFIITLHFLIMYCIRKCHKFSSVLPGRDGVVRAAKVEVLNTDKRLVMLRRPMQYLVPLEVIKPCTVT